MKRAAEGAAEPSPLVTLILYAFNEAAYVGEAVASVLAQDYEPLEIVLSDDGSTDRTFAIMEAMAAAYAGPHRVLLQRNEHNIGICSQLNTAVPKTSGALIFLANGDDRAYADRVSRTVAAWTKTGGRAAVVTAPLQIIDRAGVERPGQVLPNAAVYPTLVDGLKSRFGGVGSAASVALRRDVFAAFPPLNPSLLLEDNPLMMRAMLLGDVCYLDRPTVQYRVHGENLSQAYDQSPYPQWRETFRTRALWQRAEGVKAYTQELTDLFSPHVARHPPERLELARLTAIEKIIENELFRQFYTRNSSLGLAQQWAVLLRLARLLMKNTLKTWFPALRERDARRQYRRQFGRGPGG